MKKLLIIPSLLFALFARAQVVVNSVGQIQSASSSGKAVDVSQVSGAVSSATTITINGVTYDLSANRSWTISTGNTYTNGIGLLLNGYQFNADTTFLRTVANSPSYSFLQDKLNNKLNVTDTTTYRTAANSFTKAQTNTQISNATANFVPLDKVNGWFDLGSAELFAGAAEIGGNKPGAYGAGVYNTSATGNGMFIKGGASGYHNTDFIDYNNNTVSYVLGTSTYTSADHLALTTKDYVDAAVSSAVSGIPSGVTSFNSRIGAVVPQNGDYSAFYGSISQQNTNTANITANYNALGKKADRLLPADPGATSTAIAANDSLVMAAYKLQKQINANSINISNNTAATNSNYNAIGKKQAALLQNYALGANSAVTAMDSVGGAIGKLQAQINGVPSATATLTNKTISGSSNTFSNIPNSALTNSTISGVGLGGNLFALTPGVGVLGSAFNGSSALTWNVDTAGLMASKTWVQRYQLLSGKDAAGGYIGLDASSNGFVNGHFYNYGAESRIYNGNGGYYSRSTRTATGNILSLNNQTIAVAGIGKAIDFTVKGQYGQFADPITDWSTNWSVSVWAKFNVNGGNQIFAVNGNGDGKYLVFFVQSSGQINWFYNNGLTGGTSSNISGISANTWYNIVIIHTSSGNLTVYCNNQSLGTSALSTPPSYGGGCTFGPSSTNPGNELMDQGVFYPIALTAGNVSTIYNSGNATANIPTGHTRLFNFDEGNGSIMQDADNNGSGTYYGSVSWTNNGKTPLVGGALQEVEYINVKDGQINGEYSQVTFGDFNSGTILQGKRIGFYLNGYYVGLFDNFGRMYVNPQGTATLNSDGSKASGNFEVGPGTSMLPQVVFDPSSDPTSGLVAGAYWHSSTTTGLKGYDGTNIFRVPKMTDVNPTTGQALYYNGSYWAPTTNATNLTASGNGTSTTITVAHGLSGVSSSSKLFVTAKNSASSGILYATADGTNVYITYASAPASGTNNLSYDIEVRQ